MNSATALRHAATVNFPASRRLADRDISIFGPQDGPASRDVGSGPAVESGHELEAQFRRLPRGVREHEVREEATGVCGYLGDDMLRAEQGFENPVGLDSAHALVDESDRMEVLVEKHVEGIGPVQLGVRLLNAKQGDLVHHDHVARYRVEGTEKPLRMVPQVREGEHEPCAAATQDRLDGALHEFEEVREGPSLAELPGEVHWGKEDLRRS